MIISAVGDAAKTDTVATSIKTISDMAQQQIFLILKPPLKTYQMKHGNHTAAEQLNNLT
jgi:hypothetical protein